MLRYKTETRPGLIALYDIRPGNGAGQFLQPRSPHGALTSATYSLRTCSRRAFDLSATRSRTSHKSATRFWTCYRLMEFDM